MSRLFQARRLHRRNNQHAAVPLCEPRHWHLQGGGLSRAREPAFSPTTRMPYASR